MYHFRVDATLEETGGAGWIWGLSVLSAQFSCVPKAPLKSQICLKGREKKRTHCGRKEWGSNVQTINILEEEIRTKETHHHHNRNKTFLN